MGWIGKIQKHKEERTDQVKILKTRRKEWRKEKEEIFRYMEVVPHTCVFSIGWERSFFLKQEGKKGGKKKRRFLGMWRFPYSCVLHWSGTPSCDPPSGERTLMGTIQNSSGHNDVVVEDMVVILQC
jgi:hypothetical protein